MKILDIAIKDLVRSFRSVFAVGMMFVAPLLITGLIYVAFSGVNSGTGSFSLPDLKIAIVNLDQPQGTDLKLGKMLVDFMNDPAMPAWLKVTEIGDAQSARQAVDRQEIGVAIIVPSNFTASLISSRETASLTLIQDPTLTIGPQIVKDILTQFADGISGARVTLNTAGKQMIAAGLSMPPEAAGMLAQEYSDWYTDLSKNIHHSVQPLLKVQSPSAGNSKSAPENPIQKMLGPIMAGQMIFFAFYTGAVTAQSILREDEEGTLPRLFTTSTPRAVILGGKFISVFVTVAIQASVLMTVSALLFKINWGQPLSVLMATLGLVVVASGFGIFILSFVKNTQQSGPVLGGLLSASGMLGGLFTVNIPMPKVFTQMNLFFPQGWAIHGWKLVLDGAGAGTALTPTLIMLSIGAALFIAGAILFRRRYA